MMTFEKDSNDTPRAFYFKQVPFAARSADSYDGKGSMRDAGAALAMMSHHCQNQGIGCVAVSTWTSPSRTWERKPLQRRLNQCVADLASARRQLDVLRIKPLRRKVHVKDEWTSCDVTFWLAAQRLRPSHSTLLSAVAVDGSWLADTIQRQGAEAAAAWSGGEDMAAAAREAWQGLSSTQASTVEELPMRCWDVKTSAFWLRFHDLPVEYCCGTLLVDGAQLAEANGSALEEWFGDKIEVAASVLRRYWRRYDAKKETTRRKECSAIEEERMKHWSLETTRQWLHVQQLDPNKCFNVPILWEHDDDDVRHRRAKEGEVRRMRRGKDLAVMARGELCAMMGREEGTAVHEAVEEVRQRERAATHVAENRRMNALETRLKITMGHNVRHTFCGW